MNTYRTARTQKELEKVEEISFDKNFFNLEDPTVWNAVRDPVKGPIIWKKTYGFDHVSLTEGREGKANSTKCFMNCFKAEQSRFARKCRKGGGLFKCCMISLRIDKFELVRKWLKKAGMISSGPSSESQQCEKSWFKGNCYMCATTHICAKKNPFSGKVDETFRTPYTPQHRIGGRFPGLGLKYFGCFGMNTCLQHGYDPIYEPLPEYRAAASVEDLCNLTQKFNFTDTRNETYQASYYSECIKQTSPNVFICPNKTFHRIANSDMVVTTNILKQMDLERKIKQLRRRERSKRKKEKKETKKAGMDFAVKLETVKKERKGLSCCRSKRQEM